MATGKARLDHVGKVAVLTLDDSATRNALSWDMACDMNEAMDGIGDARALVLTGAGKGFCSGGDLGQGSEDRAFGELVEEGLRETVNPMLRRIADLDLPVISAVNGAAAGAGAPLALSADFTIAGESAFFLFAFPKVGLALDAGASWLMPRLVGQARAMQALMLAERIPAQQALEWGMIYKVVPDEQLADSALELAAQLAEGPTRSYAEIRKAVRAAQHATYSDALDLEMAAQGRAGNTEDCKEAVSAFLEKRAPVFKGR